MLFLRFVLLYNIADIASINMIVTIMIEGNSRIGRCWSRIRVGGGREEVESKCKRISECRFWNSRICRI